MEQVITRQTGVTDQTATLIYHIFTSSPDKVSQSGVIDLVLSDHDLIYFIKKTSLPKSYKHDGVFAQSMERCSTRKFLEIQNKEIIFQNYLTHTGVNNAYSDFIYAFVETIDLKPQQNRKDQSEGKLKTLV